MVKLNNYSVSWGHFVLFLTFGLLLACAQKKDYVTKIEGSQTKISNHIPSIAKIDSTISPYRQTIDQDLSTILAYAPQTLDKFTGEWQTSIGNLLADVMLAKSRPLFLNASGKNVDICLLNHGGIRAPIPKGDVTTRTAFEVMPFENSLIVVGLKSEQLQEITDYIIKEKKPHPLSGMTFEIEGQSAANIRVNGEPLAVSKTYYIVTSDYLSNGGDNMTFFKKAVETIDLNLKIRDGLIEFFRETDTIPMITDVRIK